MAAQKSGMFRQKALDLDSAPAPPRYIVLKRARGVEEEAVESEENSDVDEELFEKDTGEDEVVTKVAKSSEITGSSGDV